MAHSHVLYVAFQIYRNNIEKEGVIKCPNLLAHLRDLGKVFALNELSQESAACYEAGYFQMGTASLLLEAQKKLMVKLRPQMISLIEAWELPDSLLVSAIGNSYGDIYE